MAAPRLLWRLLWLLLTAAVLADEAADDDSTRPTGIHTQPKHRAAQPVLSSPQPVGPSYPFISAVSSFLAAKFERDHLSKASLAATNFVLVAALAEQTTADVVSRQEARMPFGGFIVNRTELGPSHVASVDELHAHTDLDLDETVTDQLLGVPRCQAKLADLHERSIQSLLSAGPRDADHWVIPDLGRPAEKLADLLDLAEHLPTLE